MNAYTSIRQKKLNVLTNGFNSPFGKRILEKGLGKYFIGSIIAIQRTKQSPELSSEQPLQSHSGNINAVHWEEIRPLDADLIEKMRPCEAVFYEMLNRKEDKGRYISYEERKNTYYKLLRYWNHVLEKEQINIFISVCLPHRVRTHVISWLCKIKNIPAFYFHHTSPIPSLFYIVRDWEDSIIGLKERFEYLKNELPTAHYSLSPTLEKYYLSQVDQGGDPTPWFVHKKPSTPLSDWFCMVFSIFRNNVSMFIFHTWKFFLARCTVQFWVKLFVHRSGKKKANAMFYFYDEHTTQINLREQYIYLPLQSQPECTTCPMAGAYVNQILIAEMLSALLPKNILLYVKEHPNQQRVFEDGRCRDISFYKELLTMNNVRLVPRSFDTFELIEHSLAVATATGSAGFEGLFRGKPFLMFGHDFYQFAPGVFMIRSLEDCKKALHSILEEGKKPTLSEMRLFLKALECVALPGYLSLDMKEVSIATEEECVENLGGLLQTRIAEVFTL